MRRVDLKLLLNLALACFILHASANYASCQEPYQGILEFRNYYSTGTTWAESPLGASYYWLSDTLYAERKDGNGDGLPFSLIRPDTYGALRCYPMQGLAAQHAAARPSIKPLAYSQARYPKRQIERFADDTLSILGHVCTRYRFTYSQAATVPIEIDYWVAEKLRMPQLGFAYPEIDSISGEYPRTEFRLPSFQETGMIALGHDGYVGGVLTSKIRAVRSLPLSAYHYALYGFRAQEDEVLSHFQIKPSNAINGSDLARESMEIIEGKH